MVQLEKPTLHGPNVGIQSPIDTSIIGIDPTAGPRRQNGALNRHGNPAVSDVPAKTHGGKVLHHCDFNHKSQWDCQRHDRCNKICPGCAGFISARGRGSCANCGKTAIMEKRARKEKLAAERRRAAQKREPSCEPQSAAEDRKPKHTDSRREQALLVQRHAHEAGQKKLMGRASSASALAKMIIPHHAAGVRKRTNRSRNRIGLSRAAVERICQKYGGHLTYGERVDNPDPMDVDSEGYVCESPYEWEDVHAEHMTGLEGNGLANGQLEHFKADA